ncbi:MAG: hypothetical protein GEU88_07625 [Solirubrobacterales bacterium]|nr:hypothetical protein [Solirubrobacterales bacterium]
MRRTSSDSAAISIASAGVSGKREITALAAAAKTNREIAATLYISDKTVDKHHFRVFTELGVTGRAAIGARLAADRDGAERLTGPEK